METRNIKITLDTARRMYEQGGEMKEIALCAFTEQEIVCYGLPKTWEEFYRNNFKSSKYYIDINSNICMVANMERDPKTDRNSLPSKGAAEAHLALMQLHQLRDCYRQGWKPDWSDDLENKHCIVYVNNMLRVCVYGTMQRFLSFQSYEIAIEFLNNFRDLINLAKDLI